MSKRKAASKGLLKLDAFLCFAVYSAGHAFNRLYQPLLDRLELTYPQYLVMVVLWEHGDQTVGGLGQKLFLESNTLTPMLKRLEAIGYISRARDLTDERQVGVRLTDKGRALREKAQEIPPCIFDATGLRAEDVVRLTRELSVLRESLTQ